jgi:hypothetical protein
MLENGANGNKRMIFEVLCNYYNGVKAIWINDSLIYFDEGLKKLIFF